MSVSIITFPHIQIHNYLNGNRINLKIWDILISAANVVNKYNSVFRCDASLFPKMHFLFLFKYAYFIILNIVSKTKKLNLRLFWVKTELPCN